MTMVILTLLLLTGLPGQVHAATVNYYVTPGTVTNVAGAPTAHTSCTAPTSSYGDLLTTSIGNLCTTAYRWTQVSPGLHSKAYFNTAYTVATTVTGTSYQVTMRDGGQVGFQLFYVNAAGNETLFGNEVTIQQADGATNNYVVDLSAQSAVVPAGSKLGLRTWGYNTNPDFRMYIGNPDGRTGNISGHLIVDEAAGGGGDTTAPTVTAFTLPATSTSPISVTSFTASDDTSVTGYMITESASAPAAGAAGWTGSAPTTITTASVGSITFYAWAKDAAGNVSASQNATVNVTGGGGGGSFEQIDDFSTGWGNWVNVTGDQRDWTRQTGTTASSNTGPTANSGADQGGDGWYVYTETSSPTVTGDQYYLESNDLDAGTYNLNISFYWNMYGANMGSLHLDVWNGSSWDLSIWSRSGNNGDAWVQQDIDLAAAGYTSGTIKLRFRGIKGSDWASDMALDTIRIYGDAAGGPDSLVVTSNTPLANSAVEGNTDVQMQRLQVDCTAGGADDGICEITGITVDDLGAVTGTEIDNLKIYIDTDTSFAGTEQNVADASFAGTSKAIDLTSIALDLRQVSAGTPKYIWVTYDLAFDAAPAAVQTSVTTVAVNTGSGDTGATGTWNSNNFGITAADGMNCASCHAYPPADGTRGVNGAVVGDHQTPAHLAATCNVCHVVPATETSADAGHRNGIYSDEGWDNRRRRQRR